MRNSRRGEVDPFIVMDVMEAARQADVERFLYTSSIGVYHPVELLVEDKAWDGRNAQGQLVPPGRYIIRLAIEGDAQQDQQSQLVGVAH